MKTDIKSMSGKQLEQLMTENGFPAFRGRQITGFLNNGVTDFSEMHTLPKTLRAFLEERCCIPHVTILRRWESQLDDTVKYLFGLDDGQTVESVLMHYKYGWSQCLSTQVGCRMGCSFCATGIDGLVRSLLPSEMMAQIEAAQQDRGIRVGSVVLMGMGEPLDNYDHVMRFLDMLSEEGGIQIGARHVSLSTCGLVDRIEQLMERDWQGTLSVSLHAPNDQLRRQLMPVARKWSVEQLLAACRIYAEQTGRRISFEYAMIGGVNDSDACAKELASRLKGMLCHVNLIPVNKVEGKNQQRSSAERLRAFSAVLEKAGIQVTVRRTLGADIEASCGQLRREEAEKECREEGCE